MPVIAIEGMVFHAPVGVYPSEKLLGNDLEVSVKIALQESVTAHEDDLAYTVDYEAIYALVRKIIAEPVNLLETAVSRIITAIFFGISCGFKNKSSGCQAASSSKWNC